MSSQRATILEYLKNTLLPTITVANGYNNTVYEVVRGFRNVKDMSDDKFPTLMVTMTHEQRKRITQVNYVADLQVIIVGYVKNSKTDLNSTATGIELDLDKLIEDMTKCIEADPLQGGLVKHTSISDIVTDDGDFFPAAGVAMSVIFSYVSTGATTP